MVCSYLCSDFPIESEGFSIQDVKTRISCINDKQASHGIAHLLHD